jgi:hypothetical protein
VLGLAQAFMAGSVGCPHPEARERCTVFVRDPEAGGAPAMGLCVPCKRALEGLIARRASREEVRLTLVPLGYTEADCEQFYGDLQEVAA